MLADARQTIHEGVVFKSRDLFTFRKISDNISETVQYRYSVTWKTNMKSYVAYCMMLTPMTLDDIGGHFCCLKPLYLPHLWIYKLSTLLTTIRFRMNLKVQTACNVKCLVETDELLKETRSQYTMKVVSSRKVGKLGLCKIDALLLQTTNWMRYMAISVDTAFKLAHLL